MPQSAALSDKIYEKCGVFGIYGKNVKPAEASFYALHALQHRGQQSCGIAVSDGREIRYMKETGLVIEKIDNDVMERLGEAYAAIGHVKNSRGVEQTVVNAEPLVANCRNGSIALALNGAITNADTLKLELERQGAVFQTQTDAEVVAHLIARSLHKDFALAIQEAISLLEGAYAIVVLSADHLYAVRDPYGIRPLVLGCLDGDYTVASETCALDAIGAEYVRDIRPGELISVSQAGLQTVFQNGRGHRLCMYELVYFARTDSFLDGISIYEARLKFGRALAEVLPVDADIVIGVPDSALAAAFGYAGQSGIQYGDGLFKNRYVGRSINKYQKHQRDIGIHLKLNVLTENVKGKRVIMVDDSIVSGGTSKHLVAMLRKAGAREVHLRVCSPPISSACRYGIETPSTAELIGGDKDTAGLRHYTGADSLAYLPLENMIAALRGSGCQFCTACFDGQSE